MAVYFGCLKSLATCAQLSGRGHGMSHVAASRSRFKLPWVQGSRACGSAWKPVSGVCVFVCGGGREGTAVETWD